MQTSRASGTDPTSRFRSDIQGLRAIAVLAVVLYHAGVPFLPGGYVGVDVFFVISGFLITSHLLSQMRRDGKIRFASFYAKRARRILPASFVVLVLSVAAAVIWYPPLLMREVWQGAVATALYVPNLLFAANGTNYLAESTPSLFQHYWSLGIEEQFYLLWPLALALGFLICRTPKRLFAVVTAVVALSFVACVALTFYRQPLAFFLLPTRAWELGVGGVVAFVLTYRPGALRGSAAAITGWIGVIGIIGSAVLFTSETQFPGFWAAVPVAATAAVILAGDTAARRSPHRVLSIPPMLYVGLISYSLYLVHWPLLQVTQAAVGFENPLPLWATLLLGALSFPAAAVLYRWVEVPGRSLTLLTGARPRRSLVAAGLASALVVVAATASYAYAESRPLNAGRDANRVSIQAPPDFTSFVPANLTPSLRAVSSDQPPTYSDGCHLSFDATELPECVYGDDDSPRIVLFGDSHAAQWFPALAEFAGSEGYAIENRTKSSCPSISAEVLRNGVPYAECTAWRDAVIEKINAERPALVVISNFGVADLAGEADGVAEKWGEALRLTLERISVPTVVLADTPNLRHTPSVCLSANLENTSECGQTTAAATDSLVRVMEQSVASNLNVPYIDLTPEVCSSERCDPIIGDTLVYRDAHHLTATFSAMLSDTMADRLRPLLRAP